MNKHAVLAVLAAGSVFTLSFAASSKPTLETPAREASRNALASRNTAENARKACRFLPESGPLESKPQAGWYRGGCLEYLPHVELETTGGLPLSLFTGVLSDGRPAPARTAVGHHGDRWVRLQLQPAVVQGHPFGPVQFYEVISEQGENLCEEQGYDVLEVSGTADAAWASQLKGKAIAIPGYWKDPDWHSSPLDSPGSSSFTLACMSGAMAKCALWGYLPWTQHNGVGLEPFHTACVQAVRARYLTQHDTAYTCTGTIIDIYDRLGLMNKDDPSLRFESRWNDKGQLDCLAESRYPVCMGELHTAWLPMEPRNCTDPAVSGWPDGVLIAVASSAQNVATRAAAGGGPVCPSQFKHGCPEPPVPGDAGSSLTPKRR